MKGETVVEHARLANTIKRFLENYVQNAPGNQLHDHGGIAIFKPPLVAFAAADDPLFAKLQEPYVIDPSHLMPQDWLAGARSVISYFLPFTEEIRLSNRPEGLPSPEWVSARITGEAFNNSVREALAAKVVELGGAGVAPSIDSRFFKGNMRSNWSERHVAYIAGLGTFGLHKNLITAGGCAGRLGSVVTSLEIPPQARPYESHVEYCPGLASKSCSDCIDRCPSGAISPAGKNTLVCKKYFEKVIKAHFNPGYGCAKCQINVPCEDKIPLKKHCR